MKNKDVTVLVEDCILEALDPSDIWGDVTKVKRWTLSSARGCVCVIKAFDCEFYGHA